MNEYLLILYLYVLLQPLYFYLFVWNKNFNHFQITNKFTNYSQFLISDINTDKPRIPSPLTGGVIFYFSLLNLSFFNFNMNKFFFLLYFVVFFITSSSSTKIIKVSNINNANYINSEKKKRRKTKREIIKIHKIMQNKHYPKNRYFI